VEFPLVKGEVFMTHHLASSSIVPVPASHAFLLAGQVDLSLLLDADLPARLILLSGRPGTGKSSLALACATASARADIPTGLISLETSGETLCERLVAQASGIETHRLGAGACAPDEYRRAKEAAAYFAALPLWVDEPPSHTPVPLEAHLALWQVAHQLRLIVVDGLPLLLHTHQDAPRKRARTVVEACYALDTLCLERSLTILAVLPLRSCPPEDDALSPTFAELVGQYGDVTGAADTAMFLHHQGAGYVSRPESVEMFVTHFATHRTRRIPLVFDAPTHTFSVQP
jgi:replicative DNA helicase